MISNYSERVKEVDGLVTMVQIISKDIGMEFGIKKCGMVVMKRGQLSSTKGILLPDGDMITEVDKNRYKCLGIFELDRIKESEMKKQMGDEYLRCTLVMKSRLNSKNEIMAANRWAVSLMRYGAGILKWASEEFKVLD